MWALSEAVHTRVKEWRLHNSWGERLTSSVEDEAAVGRGRGWVAEGPGFVAASHLLEGRVWEVAGKESGHRIEELGRSTVLGME